jgi:twitching motility protein PilT
MQLASTLQAVVYQRLLPRLDGGRVAAFEVMIATHSVRNLVREGKSRQLRNIVATGRADGMQTLEHALSDLVELGVVGYEVAQSISLHPEEISRPLAAPSAKGRAGRHSREPELV